MKPEPITLKTLNRQPVYGKTKLTWARRISQTAMLFIIGEFSFYGIFRCPFAIPYVSCTSCPVIQCPGRWLFYPFWTVMGISAILFGRAFCGWACPGGFISGLFSKFSGLGKKIHIRIDKTLHWFKYIILMASIAGIVVYSNPRWAIPIRTGEFATSVNLTFQHANIFWITKTAAILVFILIGGLLGNVWCRYLCPTGGLLEAFRKLGLFQFRKSSDCTNCGVCRNVCEWGTIPGAYNCTNCGDCKNACPSRSIRFGTVLKRQ